MATFQILSWSTIPAGVKCVDDSGTARVNLSARFQVAIDHVATRAGFTETDVYMSLYWWSEPEEKLGPAEAVAQGVAAELETAYPSERLNALRQQLIVEGPAIGDGEAGSSASSPSSRLAEHWRGWRWLQDEVGDQSGDNIASMLAFFDAFTSDSWAEMATLFTPSAVYQDARGETVAGSTRIAETFRGWKSELPQAFASEIKTVVANNDVVVVELVWAESHAKTKAVILGEFERGQIREMRHYHHIMDSSGRIHDLRIILDQHGS